MKRVKATYMSKRYLVTDTCYDLKAIYPGTTRGKAERRGVTPTLDHNCAVGVIIIEETERTDKE